MSIADELRRLGVTRDQLAEMEKIPPLTTPNVKLLEFIAEVLGENKGAWQVWSNTMFLTGGDRAEADRAFDAARKLGKGK